MRPLRYVPEDDASGVPNVVVDGSPNAGTVLTLSHWPGMTSPPHTWADTSTEMVQRYVAAGEILHGDAEVATNNHFDQDGLAGLFVLVDPDAAGARAELLADLARAGDFATYRHRRSARASMAIAALAASPPPGSYAESAAALYVDALGMLPELLDHPEKHRRLWQEEDAALTASEEVVASGRVSVREHADVGLAVVAVDGDVALPGGTRFAARQVDGPHPMALHALTSCSRLLVAHGDRYRFTYRYESWVQYRSRPIPLRVDLDPLAHELTSMEREGATWSAGPVGDLVPDLAPADASPSSIPLADVEAALLRHLRTAPPAWNPF